MKWTKDTGKGFTSWLKCHRYWEDIARKDKKVNLGEVFRYYDTSFMDSGAYLHANKSEKKYMARYYSWNDYKDQDATFKELFFTKTAQYET